MKTDKKWMERARKLYDALRVGEDIWIAMLQLGREMADEARADERERVASMIQSAARGHTTPHWLEASDHFVRLLRKPKTREQVLEEALRYYAQPEYNSKNPAAWEVFPGEVARRALEWKP